MDRLGDEPPLIAIEAEGDTGTASVERGIVRAYDRLHEANAAHVAAPERSIPDSARTLARELNVDVLGGTADGRVETLERPRVVGSRTTAEADAIRFQASAQVVDKSFPLNHPKNDLADPLALYHPDDTATPIRDRVVGAVDGARRGAAFLGLIDGEPDRDRLILITLVSPPSAATGGVARRDTVRGISITPLGREVVRFAIGEHGSIDAALDTPPLLRGGAVRPGRRRRQGAGARDRRGATDGRAR